jgi:hypothetical protein
MTIEITSHDPRVKQVVDLYVAKCQQHLAHGQQLDDMDFDHKLTSCQRNYDLLIISFYEHGEGPGGTLYAFFFEMEMRHVLLEYDTIIGPIYTSKSWEGKLP